MGGNPGRVGETNFGDYMADLFVKSAQGLLDFEDKFGPVQVGHPGPGFTF